MKKCILCLFAVIYVSACQSAAADNYRGHISEILKKLSPDNAVDSAHRYLDGMTYDIIPYSEKEDIFLNTLIPYAKKHNVHPQKIAKLYDGADLVIISQGPRLDDACRVLDSALSYIEKVEPDYPDRNFCKGRILEHKAFNILRYGDISDAHNYAMEAIKSYEAAGDCHWRISRCLYQLAVTYLNHEDYDGLAKIVTQLEAVGHSAPERLKNAILYDFYSVQEAYYGALMEEETDKRRKKELLDSALNASSNAIWLLENKIDWKGTSIDPTWNYYNRAAMYVVNFDRPDVDSVEFYLKKALSVPHFDRPAMELEARVSVEIIRGQMWNKLGSFPKAESSLLQAIGLMEQDSMVYNTMLPDRENAYKFLIELCETNCRYADALKYQKKLGDVLHEKFDLDKMNAIKDIEVKYDVERKEMEIDNLNERNRQDRKIMWLIVGGAVVLLGGAVMAIIVMRQRRMIAEQKYFEAALLVEQRDKALVEGFFAVGIDKVRELLVSSSIDEESKTRYLDSLNKLDIPDLDNMFAPAREKMTQMDLKYTVCFYIAMDTPDIASLMNVEQASVYTVRYRLKKKFREYSAFRFLM